MNLLYKLETLIKKEWAIKVKYVSTAWTPAGGGAGGGHDSPLDLNIFYAVLYVYIYFYPHF